MDRVEAVARKMNPTSQSVNDIANHLSNERDIRMALSATAAKMFREGQSYPFVLARLVMTPEGERLSGAELDQLVYAEYQRNRSAPKEG